MDVVPDDDEGQRIEPPHMADSLWPWRFGTWSLMTMWDIWCHAKAASNGAWWWWEPVGGYQDGEPMLKETYSLQPWWWGCTCHLEINQWGPGEGRWLTLFGSQWDTRLVLLKRAREWWGNPIPTVQGAWKLMNGLRQHHYPGWWNLRVLVEASSTLWGVSNFVVTVARTIWTTKIKSDKNLPCQATVQMTITN
jgi:hypothetical protein